MIDVQSLLQLTLDTALVSAKVYSFWNRKVEITNANPDEYIVYTMDGDSEDEHADNECYVKTATTSIRYYYRQSLFNTGTGRTTVKNRISTILAALKNSDFYCSEGPQNIGDVDDIGFDVVLFDCEYTRAV